MLDEIFEEILKSQNGDYAVQAEILAAMKPKGW
jgi:hypothetical protein